MFINSWRIQGVLGKEPSLVKTSEEIKVDKTRDEREKLISQGLRRTKPVWEES